MNHRQTTDFGFQTIPSAEKTKLVSEVFHTVANRYDLMNDLMSFGLHRWWKQYALSISPIRQGQKVLDIAGGTGDLAKGFLKKVGKTGCVYLADINNSMLHIGRDKLLDAGFFSNFFAIQANMERLPFKENYFDLVSTAFGLRNVTDKTKALSAIYHVLKPGGCLFVLEFSKPILSFLEKWYDRYSFHFLPKLGKWITGSEESYRYLVESIRQHPDQKALKALILENNFDHCDYINLSGGIVCLHRAYKG